MNSINRTLTFVGGKVSLTNRSLVPIVGIIFEKFSIEHIFVKYNTVDPENLTGILINLIPKNLISRKQIKLIFLSNTIMAGLGVIDLHKLYAHFKTSIIAFCDKIPSLSSLEKPFNKVFDADERKNILLKNPSNWVPLKNSKKIWVLFHGIDSGLGYKIIQNFQLKGNIPEPLRVTKLIGQALPIEID